MVCTQNHKEPSTGNATKQVAMFQHTLVPALMIRRLVCTILIMLLTAPGISQTSLDLRKFFRQDVGLTDDQISDIRSGKAVAKALPSRAPSEVFLFGAIYIHAAPESYLQLERDFDRRRELPSYWDLVLFSNPPRLSDLKNFALDNDEIQDLKKCTPGDCRMQLPASSIEDFHRSIDWSAPDVYEQVNRLLQKTALKRLLAYQKDGNQVLGVYNDKHDPTVVPQQFAYMLTYHKALPAHLPDFYTYLLAYPNAKPLNVEDTFYWAKVKFGLKPTLRVVHLITMHGNPTDAVAYAFAEKQLYSSHYFQTALDLSFCIRGGDDQKKPGFYLIMAMGSEQAGLTGAKGAIVRKAAVGRSVSHLQNALAKIRDTLESKQ
jgi:hypothetical protein